MNRRGISLLEILIASGIMIAAMVPLWGLLGSSHKQVTLSADEIKASQLAVEILEQIENAAWYPDDREITFQPVARSKFTLDTSAKVEIMIGDFPEYMALKGNIKVEKYLASGQESGKIVRLILAYKSKEKVGNEEKTYELATFIPRK
ncbi:MAG: hypothetical protein EOM80_18360 [Erysipelotrichia bacterium]|nr:hypothetical protein [Candidatus Riflebacteria bacterium]NCB40728.1 hypothetical protein [Erysipelotrichia bacterium]